MFNSENFIAVDWGTSNLRLWVFQRGECIWQHACADGITRHHPGEFKDIWLTLVELCPQNIAPDTTVIMSGMIGSNVGWVNAPYLTCPTLINDLAKHLMPVPNPGPYPIYIVPGIQLAGPDCYNVMRGEETQLLGAMADNTWYALPGTHSKWVHMENGVIQDFQTVMTGELFSLFSQHSVLGKHAVEQRSSPSAFLFGAEMGRHETCISRGVFALRARTLSHSLPPESLFEALSGLLIGHEVAQMLQHYAISPHEEIVLTGSEGLIARYQTVCDLFGQRYRAMSGETAFINGIRRLLHEQH